MRSFLVAILAFGCSRASDQITIEAAEYDVISAAIAYFLEAEPFAEAPSNDEDHEPIQRVVIEAAPNQEVMSTMTSIAADDGVPTDPTTFEDFAAKSRHVTFERRFTGIGEYELLSVEERQRIFAGPGTFTRFHDRFPGAPGLFVVSRVGVNREGTEGALYIMHLRGPTWGHLDALLFRVREGRWTLAGRRRMGEF